MSKNWKNSWPILLLVALLMMTSCGKESGHSDHSDTYTCPMHPAVVADRPGTCPVCGMDLVPKARTGEKIEITEDLSRLLKSPNENIVASVKTVRGQYKAVSITASAQGVVTYDTRNIASIAARSGGRLETVYLKSVYQPVRKGQKIATLYSPELITAQRELVFLLENDPENTAIIDASRRKLILLGLTARQINHVIETKEVQKTISIFSSHSGYVVSASPGSPLIKGGDYVSPGQTLFTVVSPDALRLELNLPGSYSGMVRVGNQVTADTGTGQMTNATVDFIQPFFTDGQEFLKMRVYLRETENLFIGQLVNATIHLGSSEALWVPKETVVDLGTRKVVFVKERGVLKPREVTTGNQSEGLTEISAGLSTTDEIAANAQYLVDSESFIKQTR